MAEKKETYFACIMHDHNGNLSASVGKVTAISAEEAVQKAKAWFKQKMAQCKNHSCEPRIGQYQPGMRGLARLTMAEGIEATALTLVKG